MTANARVIRGRILSFTDDPAASGSAAHSVIDDGAVLVEGGLIEAVGEARDILARAPRGARVDDHAGCIVTAGFIDAHIHYPQTQVIGSYGAQLLDWLQQLHVRRGAEIRRPRPLRADRRVLPRRNLPLRHDDRDGLLHSPSAIGRRVLRRGREARRAHDRRQGDDGPRRAGSAHGHGAARLRREQGADRALEQPRPARLRDHAALRDHLDAGAIGGRRRVGARISAMLRADARRREQGRDRARRRTVSRGAKLSRRLRAGGPDWGRARSSAIASICRTARSPRSPPAVGRRVLPDLQSLSRLRPVRSGAARSEPASGSRSRPTSAAGRAIRCCGRRRRATKCCSSMASPGRRCRPSIA